MSLADAALIPTVFPGYSFGFTINTSVYPDTSLKHKRCVEAMAKQNIPQLQWDEFIPLLLNPASKDLCRGRFTVTNLLEHPFHLVLYTPGNIAGLLCFDFGILDKQMYIIQVCVESELKGSKYGERLMEQAEQLALALGLTTIKLIVATTGKDPKNGNLIRWYQSQGYNYMVAEEKTAGKLEYPYFIKMISGGRRAPKQRRRSQTRSKRRVRTQRAHGRCV